MVRSLLLSILILLMVSLLPAGCENGASPDSAFTVRDSVGIQIVESSEPQLEPGPWIVSPEPVLQIGQQEGDEHYLYAKVPMEAAAGMGGTFRLHDGRTVVCDGMARTVRVFDQEGRFVLQFGRSGGGPGEFQNPIRACMPHGEQIAVSEGYRVSYFDTEGQLLDMTSLATGSTIVYGMFSDGDLLTWRVENESYTRSMEATAAGVYPVEAIVTLTHPDGKPMAWTLSVHRNRMVVNTGSNYPISIASLSRRGCYSPSGAIRSSTAGPTRTSSRSSTGTARCGRSSDAPWTSLP